MPPTFFFFPFIISCSDSLPLSVGIVQQTGGENRDQVTRGKNKKSKHTNFIFFLEQRSFKLLCEALRAYNLSSFVMLLFVALLKCCLLVLGKNPKILRI